MWNSHKMMIFLWIGAMVMGSAYLLGIWHDNSSPAFIIGQIILGAFGLARELFLRRNGFSAES